MARRSMFPSRVSISSSTQSSSNRSFSRAWLQPTCAAQEVMSFSAPARGSPRKRMPSLGRSACAGDAVRDPRGEGGDRLTRDCERFTGTPQTPDDQ